MLIPALASATPVTDQLSTFFEWLSGILWGPWLLVLLVGTHLYLTFRLGIVQKYIVPTRRTSNHGPQRIPLSHSKKVLS